MNDAARPPLTELSDADLVRDLVGLVGYGRRVAVRVLDFLNEVESRSLHLTEGYASLFAFCRRKLRFGEGEALRKIASARLLKRFPVLRAELESGCVHMTALHLIRALVTPENLLDLLRRVRGKTKREVEALVMELDPKKKRPTIAPIDQMRPLPPPRVAPSTSPPAPPAPLLALLAATSSAPVPTPALPSRPKAESGAQSESTVVPVASAMPAPAPAPAPARARAPEAPPPSTNRSTGGAAHPNKAAPPPRAEPVLEPQPTTLPTPPPAEFQVGFIASQALHDKLERLRNLLAHDNPSGDLAPIVERAIDLLLAKVEKERLARTDRPARVTRPSADPAHISNETKRIVIARDGWRCSWVGKNGERCDSSRMLEFDHVVPIALGGTGEPTNLRILCAPHNLGAAKLVFGADHVEACIARRRQKRSMRQGSAPPSPGGAKPGGASAGGGWESASSRRRQGKLRDDSP